MPNGTYGGVRGKGAKVNGDNVKYWGEHYQTLVIYHETTHFMDAWIDGEVGEVYLMKDGSFSACPPPMRSSTFASG